jgi:hypothetical protein
VSAGQPIFRNGTRLVDPVDRVLAGEDVEAVAYDFGLEVPEVWMALHVFAAAQGRVTKSRSRLRELLGEKHGN